MSGRFDETLTDDELAAQANEPLPDDVDIVNGDWTGRDAGTVEEEPEPTSSGEKARPER